MSDHPFEKLNARQVAALAESHVNRFVNLIRRAKEGAKGIQVEECHRYLGIWKSIATKVEQGTWRLRLTTQEINEVKDAILCGDYDQMLQATKDPPS